MTRRCLEPHRPKIFGNHPMVVGKPGGCIPRRGLAIALGLVVTGVCRASPQPSAAGQNVEGVAPNQSVSLEEHTVGAGAQNAYEAFREPRAAHTDAADAHQSAGRVVDRQPPIGGPPRYVRPRQPAAAAALPGGEKVVWYRTGLGALAIVLAVVGAVYWLARRWMPGVRSIESGALRVAGRATLTPKHSAALIQLGRRFILVGVSPERVSLLCEVSDPVEVAELAVRTGSTSARPSTVADSQLAVADARGAPGGGRAFDRLLAGEAAEYCMDAKESNNEPPTGDGQPPAGGRQLPTTGSGPDKTTRPLGDLLNRLRVLQSK